MGRELLRERPLSSLAGSESSDSATAEGRSESATDDTDDGDNTFENTGEISQSTFERLVITASRI